MFLCNVNTLYIFNMNLAKEGHVGTSRRVCGDVEKERSCELLSR